MTPDHSHAPSLLWTPADLAGRWQCSVSTALKRVKERSVPFLWLGPGTPRLTRRGRPLVRFRPAAVEQWEAEQERQWGPVAEEDRRAPACVRAQGLARGKRARVTD